MTRIWLRVTFCSALSILLSGPGAGEALSLSSGPLRQQQGGEATSPKLTVAGEDELAPVREIREEIRRRLGEPMQAVDLQLIMEGPDFSGSSPSGVRWDSDSSRLWFEWKRWNDEESGTFEYQAESASLRRLSDEEAESVPAANAVWDRDHQRALWSVRDAVVLYDGGGKFTRPLLEGVRGARPVAFSGDGSTAVISYQSNLFALLLAADEGVPLLRQLTDIREGEPPKTEPVNDHQRWLEAQQLALFDTLERAEERREKERQEAERATVRPLYLQGWRASDLVPDPTLTWVAVVQTKPASEARVADVLNYVTTSAFTEEIRARIKVGDDLAGSRLGILEIATGRVAWADLGLGERAVSVVGAVWSPLGRRALVQVRAQDNKDRWFAVLTPRAEPVAEGAGGESGVGVEVTLAATDHDDAWINWAVAPGYGWMPSGDAFYFVSERSGNMHLYTVAADGGEALALTRGDFEVFSPRLTNDRKAFVLEASIAHPFDVQTYQLPLSGGQPTVLTEGLGRIDSTLSPDGEWLAGRGSRSNRPWELYVKRVAARGPGARVTESPSPAFASYGWIEPEIVRFTARDGTPVPARLYVPATPHPDHPAVIFVHGAGYLHNVHRWWSSYSREYTFHHLLMERGYTVLDIDYRGSAGYGRDWRTAIYRHMGSKDLSDQVDGARYLVEEHGIDPERIGIYGGSYGGFITLMAMFTAANHFAAGAALRPVTDWAAYNHPYTSNILNTPVEDPEAYWRSSPIYFAEGLQGALLICHGLVDTNVHAQDAIRLAQRLIELRKRNWELALYPVENHGFREPASWVDEYRRILELFEEHLKG